MYQSYQSFKNLLQPCPSKLALGTVPKIPTRLHLFGFYHILRSEHINVYKANARHLRRPPKSMACLLHYLKEKRMWILRSGVLQCGSILEGMHWHNSIIIWRLWQEHEPKDLLHQKKKRTIRCQNKSWW